jgi:serine/threonine-protein kinase
MLVGQELGPFVIDKELGSGAMGTVYRGRYTKTGQVVAIKVMAPGLGGTSAAASGRFEREAEILKQLKHPNIVRLFGVGKTQGVRYFAMEYIEGQSLDRVMARRDRMSWQEVVELGKQLCAALQHAHDKGIVHRDLKPSNLMMLPGGTVKLTDFGIAKDLDETQLTATNSTVGTASYMSPEQCRGERSLTHKSDLYSLGVVFYELVTGRKPFQAESAMQMFMLHVQGSFERPSRLVLDVPVWLDNLICQLLEKKPEQRPFDAATVANVLDSIQEKVEAQQSAGVEAARARLLDRPRGERNPSEEDKDAARTLITGRGRPKKKRKKKPLHRQAWLQALGLLLLLGGVIGLLAVFLRPPSADKLYGQAKGLMESNDPDKQEAARDGPIKEYLQRYGGAPGEQTDQVRRWAEDVDVARLEKLLDRYRRWKRKGGLKPQAKDESDESAYKAAEAEEAGERPKARALWQQLQEGGGWAPLARRHLQALEAIKAKEEELGRVFDLIYDGRPTPLTGHDLDAFVALRYARFGDRLTAHDRFVVLKKSVEEDADQRFWFLFAAAKARELADGLKERKQTEEDRDKLVRKKVEGAQARFRKGGTSLLQLREIALDVIALYANNPDLADAVGAARELDKKIVEKMK